MLSLRKIQVCESVCWLRHDPHPAQLERKGNGASEALNKNWYQNVSSIQSKRSRWPPKVDRVTRKKHPSENGYSTCMLSLVALEIDRMYSSWQALPWRLPANKTFSRYRVLCHWLGREKATRSYEQMLRDSHRDFKICQTPNEFKANDASIHASSCRDFSLFALRVSNRISCVGLRPTTTSHGGVHLLCPSGRVQ
jgi:hypothetical protein